MAGYAEESASPRYGVGLNSSDMERSQHYSLRWNNHQSHVLSAFDNLLQNESLVDCTIMCEDSAVRAHKVVLSACSPYFQKIFTDNPGKHPIIVLKDVRCWEMQCILDFMYKGETSVPEPQLTSLIKAAESLKVRGLTSSDQLPPGVSISASPTNLSNGYRNRGYSPSPSPHDRYSEPSHKLSHMSGGPHSNESSPMSLTHQDQMSDRASGRASPVPGSGNCPRRKQARPRRRSGDSVNSSLDLSKAGSPPLAYTKRESPSSVGDEAGPENLSLRRSHSPGHAPAINLVKMEQLVEDRERRMEDNISDGSLDRDRDCDSKPHHELGMDRPVLSNGIHHLQEQEALQALNFMASGGGLPHPLLPPPVHSPLHHLHSPHHFQNMSSLHKPTSLPPTSSTPTYTADGSTIFPNCSPSYSILGVSGSNPGTSSGYCDICQKHVSNRTNHKFVHSHIKFRCALCGYLYSRKDTLKDHIRGKHCVCSPAELNSLVQVFIPEEGGTMIKSKSVEAMTTLGKNNNHSALKNSNLMVAMSTKRFKI